MRKLLLLIACIAVLPWAVFAVEPDEMLQDPVLEARARVVSKELRCVVCQNQDIDSSNAGVARDLRILVRERLVAGDTNDEVVSFIQARYGDFVLLKPPFKPETYALWFAPFAFGGLALAFGGGVLYQSRRRKAGRNLNTEEETQVAKFLEEHRKGTEI